MALPGLSGDLTAKMSTGSPKCAALWRERDSSAWREPNNCWPRLFTVNLGVLQAVQDCIQKTICPTRNRAATKSLYSKYEDRRMTRKLPGSQ